MEIDHGASYGSILFCDEGRTPPSGVPPVEVQLDLDHDRFIGTFLKLMAASVPSASP